MELCLPPYMQTSVPNIDITVKTTNSDWDSASVTALVGGSAKVSNAQLTNSLFVETSMPKVYFNHFSDDNLSVTYTLTSSM